MKGSLISLLGCCAITSVVFNASAADSSAVDGKIQQLLIEETRGPVDRHRELSAARQEHSAEPNVYWQSGQVHINGTWVDYADAIRETPNPQVLAEYLSRRNEAQDDPVKHFQMANWCRQHKLPDRERAHLFAAADLSPKFRTPEVLGRLGFKLVDGDWLSPERQRRIAEQAEAIGQSLKKWSRELTQIRTRLAGSRRVRDQAEAALKEINSPDAVAAIDLILGRHSTRNIEYAIGVLQQIDSYESSLVLARYAVFSSSSRIRDLAAQALKTRRFEDFVPGMLRLLATEHEQEFFVLTTTATSAGNQFATPELIVGMTSRRETESTVETRNVGTRIRLGQQTPGRESVITPREWLDASRHIERRLYLASRRNEQVDEAVTEMNQRVDNVLGHISGQRDTNTEHAATKSTTTPNDWWEWWSNYTDVPLEKKAVIAANSFDDEVIEVGEEQLQLVLSDINGQPAFPTRQSCFAAGTEVWTDSGLRPIEQIHIGDLVLAQDTETGELAFKPVLRSTTNPPRALMQIEMANDEIITATGGHLFWQAGRGWTKVRDFGRDNLVHTTTGNAQVRSVKAGPTGPTHNLVVADFHTYFVGQTGMLVDDLLPAESTNMVVPGLLRFAMKNTAVNTVKK